MPEHSLGQRQAQAASEEYARIRSAYQADAWLYGTTTTKEFTQYRKPVLEPAFEDIPDGDYIAETELRFYYISLDTAYTGLVTLVQLSASTIGDQNPVSYDIGISVILYGASLSTSGRLGLGKAENYAYDIYELEVIPEILYGVSYRKSLTTLFPRFLKAMANYHEADIRCYFRDAFGYEGSIAESASKMIGFFTELGVDI